MKIVAKEGIVPIFLFISMGITILIVGWFVDPVEHIVTLMGIMCLLFSSFLANFYRDPERKIPQSKGIIVSPADGHVMFVRLERAIGKRPSNEDIDSGNYETDNLTGDWNNSPCTVPISFETEQRWESVEGESEEFDCWRIAIFMSPLDVHVNRSPIEGKIVKMEHRSGKGRKRGPYIPAFRKESEYNERVRTVIQSPSGETIEVTQISGSLARTISPWKFEGESVLRGERYGMIRFGSRVDIRVPARYIPQVKSVEDRDPIFPKGQFVLAGADILFMLQEEEE